MEPAGDLNTGEEPTEDKAADQTSVNSTPAAPRRALRERGACRPSSAGSTPPKDTINGAATSSPRTSGRVLRDRSTRAVPAWLKDARTDEDEDLDEPSPDSGAAKRRKVCNSRRRKASDPAGEAGGGDAGDSIQATDSEDLNNPVADVSALPSRRPPAKSRAKPPSGRANRSSGKPVCKTEPGMEHPAAEQPVESLWHSERMAAERDGSEEKHEIEKKEEVVQDAAAAPVLDEDPLVLQKSDDLYYPLKSQSGGKVVESLSSDEDVPFRDDLNDQSYDPKVEREVPKPKRKIPPRQKEKKEKDKAPKKEEECAEIKVEGSDHVESAQEEVKTEEETADDPDGPRKGRRKKDDKTPRLPKRRKKPPVQYVRCEMEGCGTVLAHPRYLQHHIKYQHLLKKKYVCSHPSCGRLFRLQKQLLRHAKHHTDQRDYICEFCARAFKSSHNLAVHRMIHTGEKPLQCEICGFTCRQKASLNWHMKKHDADATYQFSCSICGKKFEKKDCVVAHKAKSHPEVLIAEALAANAGALITTPAACVELPGSTVQAEVTGQDVSQAEQEVQPEALSQDGVQATQPVSHQVVLLGQDQSLHSLQVPVTIALSPIDPPSPPDHHQQQTHLQLHMPVQFVQTTQQQQPQPQIQQLSLHSQLQQPPQLYSPSPQQQQQGQTQLLQMTFQPVSQSQTQLHQIPILATSQQLQTLQTEAASQAQASTNGSTFILDNPVFTSSSTPHDTLQQTGGVGDSSVVWEHSSQREVLTDNVQQGLM
ncbi:E3 ubiquitin-protein ligase ZFP91 isoform X2 [Gouania willdenowi]|uniref:E3 ubiquitin-protein ligase ZFP91 isoform X2 n=1 Tax=Gouania willdenowi TaxID=441366 RepID=UPI001054A230|nr:E3 ubiquitin-protein ligase ZFP91-like isoform X2 [Gouania willdenowi]